MKMLCVFSVTDRLKYIGHLDLMRAMQRALRRSGLPIRFSQGFNPRILLSFAAPLSVGMEGLREVMEVPVEGDISPEMFVETLNQSLPPLIRCSSARLVDDSFPAPMSQLWAANFDISPLEHEEAFIAGVPVLLAKTSVPALRKSKKGMVETDLRPLIHNVVVKDNNIQALLALHSSGTCKPDLFIRALSECAGLEEPVPCKIVRKALYTQQFSPLEDM
ncbi:MAG: DUF2344 domain-containing protein [Clostridiales bacterium]|nr:DUF2344 domain-containing protein [Clostridiales bacterium]